MRYSKESIIETAGDLLVTDKINGDPTYDWIDIVGIPQRPIKLNKSLYFASHSTGSQGWDNGFDRRPQARKVSRDTGWDLAIDEGLEPLGVNHIRVRSLESLASRMYEASRSKNKPYVVGVTGSVGKTTTVAFLEHLVRTSGLEVTRFYSKRLTPLSVMCHYINRVNVDTPVVVMEYSAYLKAHISELSHLLPPDIAFLVNIYNTHINPDMFKSKREIFDSKVQIKPKSGKGFINHQILSELNLPTPAGWTNFDVDQPKLPLTNKYLPPTTRTAELFTVGKLLSQEIGIAPEILYRAFKSFVPQEKRILACKYKGLDLFFHGETSGGSRLWSWFETTDGSVPWLMIEEVNFADEDPEGFKDLLEKVFSSKKTYVLDTPTNRRRLPVKANFVDQDQFRSILSKQVSGYVVYHKALASRWPNFDPNKYLQNRW